MYAINQEPLLLLLVSGIIMLGFVCFALLVAGSFASDCCSADDRKMVQKAWHEVWGAEFTGRRIAVGRAVFDE